MHYFNPKRGQPKVALIVNGLAAGGVERQGLILAKHLHTDHAADVALIYLKDHGLLAADAASLPGRSWSPRFGSGLDIAGILRLGSWLKQSGVQVAIASNQYATVATTLARSLCRVPMSLISGFHSVPEGIGRGLRSRVMLGVYERCLHSCQGLVYVSHRQKLEWTARGLGRDVASLVIPNGIDPSRYWPPPVQQTLRSEFGWKESDFVVGLCAALRPEKRVEDLVVAASLALNQGVPLRLLIIGDGPRRAQIAAAIENELPGGTARMVGFQSNVIPYIHACDAMALVSDAEAFSIAILEAMACGKAVVATDVGGVTEQIESGKHGYVVPPRSPESVANSIYRLWRCGEAATFGAAARARLAHEFSVQAMTNRYARLLIDQNAASKGITVTQAGSG